MYASPVFSFILTFGTCFWLISAISAVFGAMISQGGFSYLFVDLFDVPVTNISMKAVLNHKIINNKLTQVNYR